MSNPIPNLKTLGFSSTSSNQSVIHVQTDNKLNNIQPASWNNVAPRVRETTKLIDDPNSKFVHEYKETAYAIATFNEPCMGKMDRAAAEELLNKEKGSVYILRINDEDQYVISDKNSLGKINHVTCPTTKSLNEFIKKVVDEGHKNLKNTARPGTNSNSNYSSAPTNQYSAASTASATTTPINQQQQVQQETASAEKRREQLDEEILSFVAELEKTDYYKTEKKIEPSIREIKTSIALKRPTEPHKDKSSLHENKFVLGLHANLGQYGRFNDPASAKKMFDQANFLAFANDIAQLIEKRNSLLQNLSTSSAPTAVLISDQLDNLPEIQQQQQVQQATTSAVTSTTRSRKYTPTLKKGDQVKWRNDQGKVTGVIESIDHNASKAVIRIVTIDPASQEEKMTQHRITKTLSDLERRESDKK